MTPEGEASETWWSNAACLGTPTNLFYPTTKDNGPPDVVKALCPGCPVRRECLVAGLAQPYRGRLGWWGGQSMSMNTKMGNPSDGKGRDR